MTNFESRTDLTEGLKHDFLMQSSASRVMDIFELLEYLDASSYESSGAETNASRHPQGHDVYKTYKIEESN